MAVAGTRPEAIKLAPLKREAGWREDLHFMLVGTGQHPELFRSALVPFGVEADELLTLAHPGQSLEALTAAVCGALPDVFARHRPDMVIVQGDTTSAWATALAATDAGLPVAHVEAGLRSGDPLRPWPEERNRREIDHLSDLLYAPTPGAVANLKAEGVSGRIHLTGNSGIDALFAVRETVSPWTNEAGLRHLVVTCHRRENQGAVLQRIAGALRRLAARNDLRLLVPTHPNPAAGDALRGLLADVAGIEFLPPLDYPDMIGALWGAAVVLSDSGGVQEECPALGVPLLVLRDNSERPEAVEGGHARLVGSDPDRIVAEVSRLLDDPAAHAAMARTALPFGDGRASGRMLDLLGTFPHAPR